MTSATIRTHQLRRCTAPRCTEWTLWRHCEAHLTERERELRTERDSAVVAFIRAEEAYVAAVKADHALTVVEALRDYRNADADLRLLEARLGMAR